MGKIPCDRCGGNGKIALFTSVEDPCQKCGGSGQVLANPPDPTKLEKYDGLVRAIRLVGDEFGYNWGEDNIDWKLYPHEPEITKEMTQFVIDHGLGQHRGVFVITEDTRHIMKEWTGYQSWPVLCYRAIRVVIADEVYNPSDPDDEPWPDNALCGLYLQGDNWDTKWDSKYDENTTFPIVVWDCPETVQ